MSRTHWKVGEHGSRQDVVDRFKAHAKDTAAILIGARGLLGKRLLCHCGEGEPCRGDALIDLAKTEREGLDQLAAQAAASSGMGGAPLPRSQRFHQRWSWT